MRKSPDLFRGGTINYVRFEEERNENINKIINNKLEVFCFCDFLCGKLK